jgi:hypothetical protein
VARRAGAIGTDAAGPEAGDAGAAVGAGFGVPQAASKAISGAAMKRELRIADYSLHRRGGRNPL